MPQQSKRERREMMNGGGSGAAPLSGITMKDLDLMLYGGGVDNSPMAGSEVVRHEDGTIEVAGYTLTGVGLTGGENATLDDWQTLGRVLRKLENGLQWLIGDWIIKADLEWGSTYACAEELGFDAETLRGYVYVCRNVKLWVRTHNLSFGHHKLVAAMPEDVQREWLKRADDGQWSISQLREAMKVKRVPVLPSGEKDYDKIREQEAFDSLKRIKNLRPAQISKMTREERFTAAADALRVKGWFGELADLLYGRESDE